MPPMESVSYRVLFYYSSYHSEEDFWKQEGKRWSKNVDRFAQPSQKLHAAVDQLVAPGDNEEQKLRKIYAAIMKLENTSFTREHSAAENKAEGIKIKTAEDIWEQKRGNDDELTLLFIAMARAAGMKAYAMSVTNRNRSLFIKSYLDWGQLDDDVAIVTVNGKEMFFDPGERYCEFGKLHWKHSFAGGVRQVDGGTATAYTNGPTYKDTQELRIAELKMDSDGKLQGSIRINMSGDEALRWRQDILRKDEEEVKKDFQEELQKEMPAGVVVKTNHFIGPTDYGNALMAIVDVSGSMSTSTGRRVFLPGSFFEANTKPLFAHAKRENPIDLHFPYMVRDLVSIALPAGFEVESVPKDAEIPLTGFADFVAKYKGTDTHYVYSRLMAVANILYQAKEYPQIKNFFAKANAQDQQQTVLHAAATQAKGQ
jgi:hypothetical protein